MAAFAGVKDDESGQGLVEYALILVLVSIVSIGLMAALGTSIGGVFTEVTGALD
jgi:pilus assembly protein Flp/PilA